MTFEESIAPAQNRFVVRFTSSHKCQGGNIARQAQRRFVLADSAGDALNYTKLVDLSPEYWDHDNNSFGDVTVSPCPDASVWAFGRNRFSTDIRRSIS